MDFTVFTRICAAALLASASSYRFALYPNKVVRLLADDLAE